MTAMIPALPQDAPLLLNADGLIDWLDEIEASDWQGPLDYNELKHLAAASESGSWMLALVPVKAVGNWKAAPEPINPNPIIWVPQYDEVLDGKHRVGAANARGETWIWAYIPTA